MDATFEIFLRMEWGLQVPGMQNKNERKQVIHLCAKLLKIKFKNNQKSRSLEINHSKGKFIVEKEENWW